MGDRHGIGPGRTGGAPGAGAAGAGSPGLRRRAVPVRTCVGCRRKADRSQLRRVARARDGALAVGRAALGRGAWLCAGSEPCFAAALRRRAFTRALRGEVAEPALEWLRGKLVEGGGDPADDGGGEGAGRA